MSRCVAIAAHGKRCQQSPFRGSPYCWHHTQSRKIWAPSRPLGGGAIGGPAAPPATEDLPAVPERRSGADRRAPVDRRAGWDGDEAAARRLADALGDAQVAQLLAFLEAPGDGSFVLLRESGRLASEHSLAPPRAARTRRATG